MKMSISFIFTRYKWGSLGWLIHESYTTMKMEIYYFLTATLPLFSRLKAFFLFSIVDEQVKERWVRKWVSKHFCLVFVKILNTRWSWNIIHHSSLHTSTHIYISMLSICFWQFRVHRTLPLMRSMSSSLALIFL